MIMNFLFISKLYNSWPFSTPQLRVRARDGGSPACESYAVLTVSVRRNEFPPQWFPSAVYTTTILETHNVLTPVYTVQANDQDIAVGTNIQ